MLKNFMRIFMRCFFLRHISIFPTQPAVFLIFSGEFCRILVLFLITIGSLKIYLIKITLCSKIIVFLNYSAREIQVCRLKIKTYHFIYTNIYIITLRYTLLLCIIWFIVDIRIVHFLYFCRFLCFIFIYSV